MSRFLTNRDGVWHYARRVPTSLTQLDRRGVVKQSTKVRVVADPRGLRAAKVADRINGEVEAFWRGLGQGRAAEAKRRYDEARRRARAFGFDYMENADLARTADREAILERYIRLKGAESDEAAAALLGGEARPQIMVSRLFEEFEALAAGAQQGMSADQVRKWRNPIRRAATNLLKVVGDKPIAALTRDDALKFQDWWLARLAEAERDIGTANRDIGCVAKMLRVLDRRHRLGVGKVFTELRIEGARTRTRIPYPVAFVQSELLASGRLATLNAEARCVLYLVVETGLRLSEACNLGPATIDLAHAVPHVQVRPDGRRMKTDQSERDIPLVGVALMAMQAFPTGFPRYRDKASSLSALVNKYLAAHKLTPSGQTLYSLRHTFEDRLGAIEAPEKMIASLMGHQHSRPKYGAGHTLEHKQKWLQAMALTPPSSV